MCKSRCAQTWKNTIAKGRVRQCDAQVNLLTNDLDILQISQCNPTSTVVILPDPENQHSNEYSRSDVIEMEATKMTNSSDVNSMLLSIQEAD